MQQYDLGEFVSYSCRECGESFGSHIGLRVHEGKVHGDTTVSVSCSNCGTQKSVPKYEANQYKHHFCNPQCKGEFQCKTGTYAGFAGRTGQQTTVYACEECGQVDIVPLQHAQGPTRWCSRDCQMAGLARGQPTGSESPRWAGGVSTYIALRRCLGDRSWQKTAAEYRAQTGHKCEWCGVSPSGQRALDVHHLVPIRTGGTHHEDNLMSLCRSCHSKVERFTERLFGDVLVDEWDTHALVGHS